MSFLYCGTQNWTFESRVQLVYEDSVGRNFFLKGHRPSQASASNLYT